MSRYLQGKRVIVTGGTSGIGQEICFQAAREGARIAFCGLPGDDPEATLGPLREAGCESFHRLFDMTDLDATRQFARDAIAFLGGLDGLVNNAGTNFMLGVLRTTREDIHRCFHNNVYPAWAMCQECHGALKEAGWGMIVNLSSINAVKTMPGVFPYNASKAALIALTQSLAIEWGKDNIQSVALMPDFIMTPSAEERMKRRPNFEEMYEGIVKRHPIQRMGMPQDIASFVVYLLSGQNQFISGTGILIDGGLTIQRLVETRKWS